VVTLQTKKRERERERETEKIGSIVFQKKMTDLGKQRFNWGV
jgi:hypothetical protein